MIYYPVKKDERHGNTFALDLRPSLQEQHLEYCIAIEDNRARMAQRAFGNTAILIRNAESIIEANPSASAALEEIMRSYLDATRNTIESYGKSKKWR